MFPQWQGPGQKCPGTGRAGGGCSASPAPRGPGCPPASITAWNWECLSLLSQGLAITLPSQRQSAPSALCIPKESVVTFWLPGGAAGTDRPRSATLGPSHPLAELQGGQRGGQQQKAQGTDAFLPPHYFTSSSHSTLPTDHFLCSDTHGISGRMSTSRSLSPNPRSLRAQGASPFQTHKINAVLHP